MAHLTARGGYRDLVDRLNRFPQGAAPSPLLDQILRLLFSPEDAELVAKLPLKPFRVGRAARAWGVSEAQAARTLEGLAGRALLIDMVLPDGVEYVLPPPMAGFFEFALMRVRDDLDQRLLAELYEQYISVEDDFMRGLFVGGTTQLGRVLVAEDQLADEHAVYVLDHERASRIIDTASVIGVSHCYCRHKRQHLGLACRAEQEICMTFNVVADALIRHGHARRIERSECHALLHKAFEQNLAQFGENVQQGVNFICNCCPCCCEAMLAHQRFGYERPIHTSNFVARVEPGCTGCGRCLPACPAKILTLETEGPNGRGRKRAVFDEQLCLGCGVCARVCPHGAMTMQPRPARVLTPVNSVHKTVLMAIERGKLQHLVFDNRVLFSHRALAALLGAILKLPPIKRLLASEQLGSRYLGRLCERYEAAQGR